MVLTPATSTAIGSRADSEEAPRVASTAVIWHDLECGGYRADLPLWRELAEEIGPETGCRILDVGAGTGRVSLHLARAGHHLTALDSDGELLDALRERAGGTRLETVQADARSFELEIRDYPLCVIPMQTLQLLGGARPRMRFLRHAHSHLRPGGLLACAIVTDLEPFDSEIEGHGPSPESAHLGGALFVSRALSVRVDRQHIRIERERTITPGSATASTSQPSSRERNVVELDRLSVARLRRDGLDVGFSDGGLRSIPETDEHVGSSVVLLRA
jgi:SAM-dependent methyltransferase